MQQLEIVISTDFPDLISAGVYIQVFSESVIRPFAIFPNVSIKNFRIQTLNILLKHAMTQYPIVISQEQRCTFASFETYWQQYLETKTKNKIYII